MTTPPLPPGFVLEDQPEASSVPPLPPGFELESAEPAPLEIDIVGGTRESAPESLDSSSPTSSLDQEGRGLGLGARSVIQGAGNLLGMLGGDAFNAYVATPIERAITGRDVQPQSYRQAASNLADSVGLPAPQNSRERVLGDVGEALTGTGLTLGIGGGLNASSAARNALPVANPVGNLLAAQPGLQAVSSATGAAASGNVRESGGSQGQQLAAGLIGGLAPGVATSVASSALRGAVRGNNAAQMQRTIDDFAALGATPSVGQASQNQVIQAGENLLGGAPTSAGVIGRFADRQADQIGEGLQRVARQVTPNPSAERAGRAIERGVETFSGNTSATKQALYWQADQLIPPTTPVPMSNTWQALADMTTPTQGAQATTGAMANSGLVRLRDNLMQDLAAGGGQIPYSALKEIRTRIGEQMTDFSLQPETSSRELRRLYASLSRDMESAAQSQGPDAVRAARRANNYTRATADRIEQVQRVIEKNGGPEKVYLAATAGVRDGGTTLRAVMQSLPEQGQRAVTGAFIRRMGLANPGAQDAAGEAFSAQTFLTNWNKVSPEAKRALFDRYGPDFSRDMDRVARVAENIRDGSRILANPSGTANRAASYTYGAALVASLLDPTALSTTGLVGGGIAANAASRYLTNPNVVRWLARTTTLPRGSIPAVSNSIRTDGERKEDPDLIELSDYLQQSVSSQAN